MFFVEFFCRTLFTTLFHLKNLIETFTLIFFLLIFYLRCHFRKMGCLGSKDRLTKEDMEFLKTHTRYDEATIKEWYKGFKVN